MKSSKFDSHSFIRTGIESVLDLLTTTNCIVCGNKSFGKRLCPDCEAFLSKPPAPVTKRVNNHDVLYFGFYEEKLRDFILSYKFHNHHSLCGDLAKLVNSVIVTHKVSFDIITYVPATKSAKKRRGYDHVELITKQLSKLVEKPWIKSMEAVRETDQLKTLDRKEAVMGKFDILDDTSRFLTEKKVLLIDDVLTTGSTMEEASKILKLASPSEVIRLVIAIKK
ncbi:MAG TPA: phosphoribosyltransferase family protein [Fervidobacterium sp.]|nr:phosphoribosyltransferase family protein [Fervidobacterium sp.]HPV62916.1 phosphoribosyltransferase family protein [Fervidobacterium sp.]HQO05282.1 phosphoribosyltransferase family protein [Fervidobacterium sp.]